MKKTKYIVFVITMLIVITLGITLSNASSQTQTSNEEQLKQFISEEYNVNTDQLDVKQAVELYNQLSEQYTNEELAKMLEENKQEIVKAGIPADAITAGTQILKTTDTEELRKIINNDLDVDKIQEMLNKGYSTSEIIKQVATPEKTFDLAIKMLLANTIVKALLLISFIFLFFNVILRWIIFNKAGKHGWAAIIPIYRHIVYLKVCGISPWLLLFAFIPIFGWLILWIVNIISKFELAKAFGRGFFFGLGLWFFNTIFELILACSKRKYVGFEE